MKKILKTRLDNFCWTVQEITKVKKTSEPQRNPGINMTYNYVFLYILLCGKAVLSIGLEPLPSRQGEYSRVDYQNSL